MSDRLTNLAAMRDRLIELGHQLGTIENGLWDEADRADDDGLTRIAGSLLRVRDLIQDANIALVNTIGGLVER